MKTKLSINYFYFALTILYVSLLSLSHILAIQHATTYLKVFLSIYAVMQAFLEVSIFILVGFGVKKISKIAYRVYIGFLFLFLIAHYIDYTILRLMDTTIITSFKIFFASGIDHFIASFKALNLNLSMALIIVVTTFTVPLIGVVFYLLTHKLALKKPLSVNVMQVGIASICLLVSLFVFDILAMPYLTKELHTKCEKTLPFKSTFLSPNCKKIALDKTLVIPNESYNKLNINLKKKPNIYIFIIETLREDIITEEVAPNLFAVKKNSFNFKNCYSNSNASQAAWFAIFHSKLPLHFKQMSKEKYKGAIPLKILKELGYKIHVHSSADLKYFNMEENLFGKDTYLVDEFNDYTTTNKKPSYRDQDAMNGLLNDLQKNNKGTCFITFLDSTHSEYNWAANFPIKFLPISKEIDYLTISHTRKGLDKLINRYKNSVNYVDFLFTDFFKALKAQKSIVVVTGDHGEEFFENGALFHGTHLNHYQTAVPIIYKIDTSKKVHAKLTSHIDIFPTIFDSLLGSSFLDTYFDGTSIFSKKHIPYVITVQQSGGNSAEFALTSLKHKLTLKFANSYDIYNSSDLELISLKTLDDKDADKGTENVLYNDFKSALKQLICN